METPNKLMAIARAKLGAGRDRDWLNVEEYHAHIERIAKDGPSRGDRDLVKFLAVIVDMELNWRKINRIRMEQGEPCDE